MLVHAGFIGRWDGNFYHNRLKLCLVSLKTTMTHKEFFGTLVLGLICHLLFGICSFIIKGQRSLWHF